MLAISRVPAVRTEGPGGAPGCLGRRLGTLPESPRLYFAISG